MPCLHHTHINIFTHFRQFYCLDSSKFIDKIQFSSLFFSLPYLCKYFTFSTFMSLTRIENECWFSYRISFNFLKTLFTPINQSILTFFSCWQSSVLSVKIFLTSWGWLESALGFASFDDYWQNLWLNMIIQSYIELS